MLKQFNADNQNPHQFKEGTPVYVVTKEGKVLEGFFIQSSLLNLVSLNSSPIDGSDKQGFTITGEILKPNWCEGKKKLIAACIQKQQALKLAEEAKERWRKRIKEKES